MFFGKALQIRIFLILFQVINDLLNFVNKFLDSQDLNWYIVVVST
jgi:hypothetical protein